MEPTTIVKFLSLALAAGFAILGTTTDYKKDGQVTKWGRVAIIGVIVSGLLSSILLGIEENTKARLKRENEVLANEAEIKANNDKRALNEQFDKLVVKAEENIKATAEALNKTDKVASDLEQSVADQKEIMAETQNISGGVNRSISQQNSILGQMRDQVSLQQKTFKKTEGIQEQQTVVLHNTLRQFSPMKSFAVSYFLKYSLPNPRFTRYLENLKQNVDNEFPVRRSGCRHNKTLCAQWDGQMLQRVRLELGSNYFPDHNKPLERNAAIALKQPRIEATFYKNTPLESADGDLQFHALPGSKPREDEYSALDVGKNAGYKNLDHITVEVIFNGENPEIRIFAITENIDMRRDKGNIVSFIDLPGTRLKVLVPHPEVEISRLTFLAGDNFGRKYDLPADFQRINCEPSSNENCLREWLVSIDRLN